MLSISLNITSPHLAPLDCCYDCGFRLTPVVSDYASPSKEVDVASGCCAPMFTVAAETCQDKFPSTGAASESFSKLKGSSTSAIDSIKAFFKHTF